MYYISCVILNIEVTSEQFLSFLKFCVFFAEKILFISFKFFYDTLLTKKLYRFDKNFDNLQFSKITSIIVFKSFLIKSNLRSKLLYSVIIIITLHSVFVHEELKNRCCDRMKLTQ